MDSSSPNRHLSATLVSDTTSQRKVTGPRFLREAMEDSPKDPKIAELQDASGDAELQVAGFYTQLKRGTPYAFVTPALVLINVGVFAAMIAGGVDLMSPSIEHLLRWGVNFAPKTTGGEWWRLLTESWIDSEKGADGYQIKRTGLHRVQRFLCDWRRRY